MYNNWLSKISKVKYNYVYFGVNEIAACIKMKLTKNFPFENIKKPSSDEIVTVEKLIKVRCQEQIQSGQ